MKAIDITGQQFGKLRVVELSHRVKRRLIWLCRCDCGSESRVAGGDLRNGHTSSCGCAIAEANRKRLLRHGLTSSKEYKSWCHMKYRCLNPRCRQYPLYGGRGITICERWLSFEAFYSDMGSRPSPKHSLDRINNGGNYEPSNCRWATQAQQCRNYRRNRLLTLNGETLCVRDWERRMGFKNATITRRLMMGWSAERAILTKPVGRWVGLYEVTLVV